MSKSGKITNGPFWSQNWFEAMWRFTCNNFVNFDTGAVDFEALGREEYEFRKALFFRNFKNSKRARTVFDEAKAEYDKKVENGMKGGRPRKNPQDAPHGNAGVDSKSATSCDQFTADGDTREDSHDGKSGTSANHCGPRQAKNRDASHREAEDESANVSNTFALDMPGPDKDKVNAKTRDSRGSGRYQPPSLGPEDGNLHDQETASGNYQVPDKVSTKPTGGHLKRSSSRSPVGDVLSLAYSGEFGNVRLTQEQYAELGIRFGNQQKLNRAIDSLSCLIENGEKNPQNHYAELVKWASYRDDMDERKEELRASTAPHYETVSEHNARIVRESDAWIHEYCQQQKKNRKAANG